MFVRILLVCWLAGCTRPAPAYPVFPGAEAAIDIVWREVYGRLDPPPRVEWVHVEPGWGCSEKSADLGFRLSTGQCVGGVTYSSQSIATAEPIGGQFHQTGLAHELLHALWLRQRRPEPHHSMPGAPAPPERDAEFFGTFGAANRALQAAGR
jgi:hypothetical protein